MILTNQIVKLHKTVVDIRLTCILCLIFFSLSACRSLSPSEHFDNFAKQQGFSSTLVTTAHFTHKIYRNDLSYLSNQIKRLHVYLDGDGTPWEQDDWLAEDPTARNPLIVRLMRTDQQPAIILGRPCYYGLSQDKQCHFKYWTSHRYAKEIVTSLVEALNLYLYEQPHTELILIGYSGGGALTMLMAPHLPNLRGVITLAANLDTRAWSEWHKQPLLTGSLNPADFAPLDSKIRQLHFAGELDTNVPISVIDAFILKQNTHFKRIKNLTHNGCWECIWPDLLLQLKQ